MQMRQRQKKYRAAAALLFAAWAAWPIHAAVDRPRRDVCPLEIIGTWKAAAGEPRLLSFAADGWANVLGSTGENRPAELDILAQMQFKFAPRREPRRIEFQTRRGNDIVASGSSSWEIIAYTDETFSARSSSAEAGEQLDWTRVQTHRYFLTLAARGDTTLFVMWTALDGNTSVLEALGTTTQGTDARFGRIPQKLASAFATQSERTDDAMVRVELSEAEYSRTHEVFVSWDTLVSRDLLARENPRHQAVLLLDATLQSLNRCGLKVRTVGGMAQATSNLPALDLVRSIKKLNDRAHVSDKAFPFRWQPPPAI
jgi:hypothetical protein